MDQVVRAPLRLWYQARRANADCQASVLHGSVRMPDIQFGDGVMDTLGNLQALTGARARQNDGKFLPAVAAYAISLAHQAAVQRSGNLLQRIVPGLVSQLIVEVLEVIHIQHQQPKRCLLAAQASPFADQGLVKVAPVEQAGQPVLVR